MELRRMHPSVVRRWIVIRLVVPVWVLFIPWMRVGPSRRGGPSPALPLRATSGLIAFVIVTLLLVRRTYRQANASPWHVLVRWHTAFGALMLCAYPASLLFDARNSVARALMGHTWYAVLLLLSASRIRDGIRERIWEQDSDDVAPVFD